MSATNHTLNYDLSQFVGGDIPSWLGDYNGDMGKIDSAIAEVATGAGSTASEVNSLKSRMTAAEADIDTAEGNITQLQTTTSSQGASISTNTTNIASLDTRVTALEQGGPAIDLDITAHTGSITPTAVSPAGVVSDTSDLSYAMNDDYSIGKIYGGLTMNGIALTANTWTKVASIAAISGMTAPSQAYNINIGAFAMYVSGAQATRGALVRLVFNTDGTIDIEIKASESVAQSGYVYIALAPCLYFFKDFGD